MLLNVHVARITLHRTPDILLWALGAIIPQVFLREIFGFCFYEMNESGFKTTVPAPLNGALDQWPPPKKSC